MMLSSAVASRLRHLLVVLSSLLCFGQTVSAATWTAVTAPTTETLRAVWGTSSTNVWACGGTTSAHVMFKYNGSTWTAQTLPAGSYRLIGMWGADANNVWACGNNGTIVRTTDGGANWSVQTTPVAVATLTLDAMWGTSATNIWAVGGGGSIIRWDGTSWSFFGAVGSGRYRGIWGSSASDIWAVTDACEIARYNGSTWSLVSQSATTQPLFSVFGVNASNVWAGGNLPASGQPALIKWDGSSWAVADRTGIPSGTLNNTRGIAGDAANRLWLVNDQVGYIGAWNGTTWSTDDSNGASNLQAIWMAPSADFLVAVGASGTLRTLGVASPGAPEIGVTEAGVGNISDNTGTFSFGTTPVGTPVTKTFTIANTGTATLNLSGLSVPSGFSIAQNFDSSTVAPNSSTTFQITMSAGAVATPSGTLSFTNDDADENPYNFTISGTVNPAPLPGGNLRLTYSGPGTALSLTETSVGNDTVTVSTPAANTLRIHLNGRGFDPTSSLPNVTYEYAGLPAASTYADVSVLAASSITTLTINPGSGTDTLSFGPALGANIIGSGISLTANGNITLTGSFSASSVEVTTTSSIVQSAGTVTATNLALSAATGIGTSAAARISTVASNLEAQTTTGGIFIGNTGNLSIGGFNAGLSGVLVATSGAIDILNTSGNVRITTGGEQVKSPGNVIIKTVTTGHIITANNFGFGFGSYSGSVSSTGGTLTLDAAGDIDLGETNVVNYNGDVQSRGNLRLTAGGNITLDDQASVQTTDNGSTITIIAGGNVSMLHTYASGSLIGNQNSSGGLVSVTTGAGGTFTLDGDTTNPGLLGGAAGVVVAADNMVLPDDINLRANGQATLKPVTAGRAIDLGTKTAGKLALTDAELDLVVASTLNIGDANSGSITVSAPISPVSYPTLALVGNTTFAAAGGFASDVTSATVFEKMTVTGTVDITPGATLAMVSTGGYVWNGTTTFTLLANDLTDAITGNFTGPTLTNFLGSTLTAGQNYSGGTGNDLTFGRPTATVVSLNRVSGNPRNAPTVTWQIVFSQPVSGLGNANFTLVNGGLTAPSISGVGTSIEASEPDTHWSITASTGTGSGTLGLNFINDTNLSHQITTALPFVGQVYTIDKTAPTATHFNRQNPNTTPTNADTLVWRVIFTEDVNNVTGNDFALTGTTATVTDVAAVTGNSEYDLTVSGGDLATVNGLIDLNFSGTQNITDLAGNALGSTVVGFDQHYVMDNTAPTVVMSSATGDPAANAAIPVTVQFSETVFNFIASDIVPTNATVAAFTAVDGDTYTFNLVPTGPGVTAMADIAANVANDEAGNGNTAATQFSRTILDAVSIAATTATAVEGGATGLYTFTRVSNVGDVTVNFQRDASSTATAGTDFTLTGTGVTFDNGTGAGGIVIPNGSLTATVTLTALTESPNPTEAAETARLNVTTGTGYVPATAPNDNATVTISANSFLVSTTADSGTGSLRQAVVNANAITGADTITFSDGTGGTTNFTDAVADTITLSSGQIAISSDINITGPGADLLIIRNTAASSSTSRVFNVQPSLIKTVTFRGLTMTGGNCTSPGGGLFVGGNDSDTINIIACAISGNSSASFGAGIRHSTGTLSVISSTIAGNTSTSSGGGGGIDTSGTALTLINSTVSGNSITGSSTVNGGGVYASASTTTIRGCTITNNTGAGGISGVRRVTGAVTVANSIIAGNVNNTTLPDVGNPFTSGGGNLIGNAGTATGFTNGTNSDQVGTGASPVNPQLGALASNGGRTQTHALLAGSTALNAGLNAQIGTDTFDLDGNSNTTEAIPFDQRGIGFTRAIGTVDIGAYELQKSVSISDLAAANEGNTGTTNFTFTITRTGDASDTVSMTYTVSGTAVNGTDFVGGTLPTGTATITAGNATTTVSIPISGDTTVEPDEAFIVTLSAPDNGYVVLGTLASSTITNDDTATLTLSGGGLGGEGGTRTFTATLSNAVQGGLTVDYTTSDTTATTADNDYVDNDGTLTFAGTAGESQTITVTVNGDDKVELDEAFTVALGTVSGVEPGIVTVVGSPPTGTISNDDFAQVLVTSLSQLEGAGIMTLNVTLSIPVDAPVSVNFTTKDSGTAQSPGDFTSTSGTVTFPAGSTTAQSVPITIINDDENEADEYLILEISSLAASGRNVSIGNSQGSGTIQNDDALTVSISATDASADENTLGTGTYRISRNGTVGTTTVRLQLDASNNASATDFTQSGASFGSLAPGSIGTIVIPDGSTYADIILTPEADIHAEADETVRINLLTDASYGIGSPANATVTIGQNDFVVINTNDSGDGTLRQALLNANAIAGANTITFEGSVFTDASADTITLASELPITSAVTVQGPSFARLSISGNGTIRCLLITGQSFTVTLSDLDLTNGFHATEAGGITINDSASSTLQINLVRSSVSACSGQVAGGILNNRGFLTLMSSALTGNTATGSGIPAVSGGILSSSGGTVHLLNSTLSGNSAVGGGNQTAAGGLLTSDTTVTLGSTTITANTAAGATETTASGFLCAPGQHLYIANTIVAGNVNNTSFPDVLMDERSMPIPRTTGGGNIIGHPSSNWVISHANDIYGTAAAPMDPLLGPLADNGGSTQTHMPLNGSPAINLGLAGNLPADTFDVDGDSNIAEALPLDQRGGLYLRQRGPAPDAGAVEAFAFEPIITATTTNEDTQTASGLVISANPADAGLTTHYKVTSILNGALFLSDGTTLISDGDFITVAEGTAGLKFTPSADASDADTVTGFGFSLQAATSAADVDLQGSTVDTTIAVDPVADVPTVTDATTLPDTQTTSGLVIAINAVDGKEVTHFKITNIQDGTLYQNNGTTAIPAGSFITVLEGNAGLKFTPTTAFVGDATFNIQGATDNLGSGLSGITIATITVNHPVPDIVVGAPPVLNLRTGLFEQFVTVTNSSTVIMDGFRLTVVNMVPSVILWNRTHAFLPVIEDFNDLAPGASRQVLVQFYTKSRNLNGFIPQYEIENLSAGLDPLSGSVAGLYHGIIDRSTDAALSVNPEIGARFELTVTTVGTVSGVITEGAVRRPFTGRLSIDPSALTQPYLRVRIPRTSVDLEMIFDASQNLAYGGIYGSGPGAQVIAWRKVWRTRAPLNLATAYKGRHNIYMENVDIDGPQGFGSAIVNVTGNDGTFSQVFYLPDGTIFTGSGFVGPQGQVRIYKPLYANKGSVLGFLQIIPGATAPTDNEVLGFVDWMKPAAMASSKDRVYKGGFGPVLMICEGGYYAPPAAAQLIFGIPAALPGDFNSGIDFYEGGLDTEGLEFLQETRIYNPSKTTGRTNLAQVISANPNKVVISYFSSATGIFAGTFTLPAQVGVVGARKVNYRGLLVPACGCTLGYGYFLLPQVPVLPQTLSTSPVLSGRLEWLDKDEFVP